MKCLVVWVIGGEFDCVYLVYCDIGCYFWLVCGWWNLVVVGVCDFEVVVVQMDWVICYCQVVEMNLYVVVGVYWQWIDVWEYV